MEDNGEEQSTLRKLKAVEEVKEMEKEIRKRWNMSDTEGDKKCEGGERRSTIYTREGDPLTGP